MVVRKPQKVSVPPTLSPAQAIILLRRQSERADQIATARHDDPQVAVWKNSTESLLNQTSDNRMAKFI